MDQSKKEGILKWQSAYGGNELSYVSNNTSIKYSVAHYADKGWMVFVDEQPVNLNKKILGNSQLAMTMAENHAKTMGGLTIRF